MESLLIDYVYPAICGVILAVIAILWQHNR
jgi:hypothetical protein